MPIAGLVVLFLPEKRAEVQEALSRIPGVEIHGWNERGEMVVVYEGPTLEEMEKEVKSWPKKIEGLLSVNVAYFHAEDEIKRITEGEYIPPKPWT